MKNNGLFRGRADGITSMRRVLAFLFALTSIFAGSWATLDGQTWGNILSAYGMPGLLSCLMMGLTTMEDITKITGTIRRD